MSKPIFKTSWDLSALYSGINDPKIDADIKVAKKQYDVFCNKWQNRDFTISADSLLESLQEYEKLLTDYDISNFAYYFAYLNLAINSDEQNVKALYNKLSNLSRDFQNQLEFYTNKLSKIDSDCLIKYSKDKKLANYKHYLEKLAKVSKHILSEKEEQLITSLSKPAYANWNDLLENMLNTSSAKIAVDNKKVKKSFSELTKGLLSESKETRAESYRAINKILKKNLRLAEVEINSILETFQIDCSFRKIDRPDKKRHIADDIETETIDTLIETITSRFDLSKKYYELKAKLLNEKKLKYYDRNAPIGNLDIKYSLEETINIVEKSLSSLDSEFGKIFMDMVKAGQIDFYPRHGKSDGAFCASSNIKAPIYIMMNFEGTVSSITTLSHEIGHAINRVYMKNNSELNNLSPLAISEVPSTFMEDFALEEIKKQSKDKKFQLALLMEKLNADVSTIFRQVACYNFERELHQEFRNKRYLSNKDIGEIFQKHMKSYMGDAIEYDENSKNWWIHWSHIRNPFYVYSYASGLLISKAMQNKYKSNKAFISNIKQFLTYGGTKCPEDIFLDMGINIKSSNFWLNGISEIETAIDEVTKLTI